MTKTIKYVGLDVHKNSISVAITDQDRDGEIRYYGRIANDMHQLPTGCQQEKVELFSSAGKGFRNRSASYPGRLSADYAADLAD